MGVNVELFLLFVLIARFNKWVNRRDQQILTEDEYREILMKHAGHYKGIYRKDLIP